MYIYMYIHIYAIHSKHIARYFCITVGTGPYKIYAEEYFDRFNYESLEVLWIFLLPAA